MKNKLAVLLVLLLVLSLTACHVGPLNRSEEYLPPESSAEESVTETPTPTPTPEESSEESVEELSVEESSEEESAPESEAEGPAVIAAETVDNAEQTALEEKEKEVDAILADLSTEEKIAQLFFVTPDALARRTDVTQVGDTVKSAFQTTPVGGLIFFKNNITGKSQIRQMTGDAQKMSERRVGLPIFLSVDEEGGEVTRISGRDEFSDIPEIPSMREVGESGSETYAREVASQMAVYLADLGFNMDFAPVLDVLTNPANTVIGSRSFGNDPNLVARMGLAVADELSAKGIIPCFKHFPGHGNTTADTHDGYAYTGKDLQGLTDCELIPFTAAIEDGAKMIMVGHFSLPNVTGDNTPASMSQTVMTEIARNRLGFNGILITDALNMGAIVGSYGEDEAAVQCILAGADMLLMPSDFYGAYRAVWAAVNDGTITEERLDASVKRIIRVKLG
ncbi:MAG: glycoside hydrolase family 3 protein [Lachnospiraceae bacterium]|nr:glycoside hydrolase family 3 protein [Lachnospiraceae bacterium]